jgi:redox-sensitive bicupin YhaK (pirin superfamily)
VLVDGLIVEPGWLALIPPGSSSIRIESRSLVRAMLLGGEPMQTRIQMWWNFVGRNTEELTQAWRDWDSHNTDRFGHVPSDLERIDAPTPPWISV